MQKNIPLIFVVARFFGYDERRILNCGKRPVEREGAAYEFIR